MRLLTVNAGSSSLKLRVLEGDQLLAAEELPTADIEEAEFAEVIERGGPVEATVHRLVHGGQQFEQATQIDDEVESRLRTLTDVAPLHQARALQALGVARKTLPGTPAVACFDTAFHATLPPAAATYAVPREWREGWGVRRYGFHGLSHAYASRRAAELVDRPPAELRTVVCHLGAGASLCAVRAGDSIDTTMGFTPLEGLVMATRAGSVDPGAVLWLQEHRGLTAADVGHALEHESGVLALAGSADMRDVLDRAGRNDPDAALALDVYVHRLVAGIGAMVAALEGVDVLVFTGGVGENADPIRVAAAEKLAFLGVAVDTAANADVDGDADISPAKAAIRTLVIHAREDLEMARQAESVLA